MRTTYALKPIRSELPRAYVTIPNHSGYYSIHEFIANQARKALADEVCFKFRDRSRLTKFVNDCFHNLLSQGMSRNLLKPALEGIDSMVNLCFSGDDKIFESQVMMGRVTSQLKVVAEP